jgi:hypothetical protein
MGTPRRNYPEGKTLDGQLDRLTLSPEVSHCPQTDSIPAQRETEFSTEPLIL